jgi:hypothetical protein
MFFFGSNFALKGNTKFQSAQIAGNVRFDGGVAQNPGGNCIELAYAKIEGSVTFINHFKSEGSVSLTRSRIGGDLELLDAEFTMAIATLPQPPTSFFGLQADYIHVEGLVRIGTVQLGKTECLPFVVQGGVSLAYAKIEGSIHCVAFSGFLDTENLILLESAQIKGDLILTHMNLGEGWLLLQRSRIQGALLLSDFDNPEELSRVDLRFAFAGTVDPNPNSWPKSDRLFLDGFQYSAFGSLIAAKKFIDWLRLSNRSPLMLQPYEQAARVLMQSGYESEAKQTLIAKFEDLLKYGDLPWLQRLWNRCVGVTVGYGYRSHRALLVMIGIIVVGTVLFQAATKNHLMLETNISWASDVKKANYPKFQPLLYSMGHFSPDCKSRPKGLLGSKRK